MTLDDTQDLGRDFFGPFPVVLVPLLKLRESVSLGTFEVTWALIVVAVIGIALFVPSRAAAGLAVFVIVTLATVSILAQVVVVHRTAADRRVFFGASPPNSACQDQLRPGQAGRLLVEP